MQLLDKKGIKCHVSGADSPSDSPLNVSNFEHVYCFEDASLTLPASSIQSDLPNKAPAALSPRIRTLRKQCDARGGVPPKGRNS
jgi:hypothetical protein